jgi:hypothetical protein
MRTTESRGFKDIPRGQGCRQFEKRKRRGEIRFKEFRARSPQTRDRVFVRAAHMTGVDGHFKAGIPLIPPNDE